jgi:hypothetical protein
MPAPEINVFAFMLRAHWERYPAMQLADVYKLIHQAALGSEHAVRDAESARHWLERELAAMGEASPEPLFDLLSAETGIARVHLRPYLATGWPPEALLTAFLGTAQQPGSKELLVSGWATACKLACQGQLAFTTKEMDEFFIPLQAQNFPAIHHSAIYAGLYHPAYRVVHLDQMILACPAFRVESI